jgi:hypothetical protein
MIFTKINTLEYSESFLKIKGVSQNISIRFKDIDFKDHNLRLDL